MNQNSDNRPDSIRISGSSGVNIARGNQNIQGDNNQVVMGDHNQVQQSQGTAAEALTKEDVLALFAQLNDLIQGSGLPNDAKDEAVTYLKAAKTATEKDKPKETIKTNLETMTETLSEASKTVEAGKTFWQAAQPIMVKIGTWLGIAAFGALL